MHNFRELEIWKKAITIANDVYAVISKIGSSEKFGIIGQLHRAVVSISSNIAEGSGRGTNKDFVRFLHIGISSLCEVQSLLFLCMELNLFQIGRNFNTVNKA